MRGGTSESEAAIAWAAARFGGSRELFDGLEAPSRLATREAWQGAAELGQAEREQLLAHWQREDTLAEDPHQLLSQLDEARQNFLLSQLDARWLSLARGVLRGGALGESCASPQHPTAKLVTCEVLMERRPARHDLVQAAPSDLATLWAYPLAELHLIFARFGAMQLAESWRRLDRRQLVRVMRTIEDEDLRAWIRQDLVCERDVSGAEAARLREVITGMSRRFPSHRKLATHTGLFFLAVAAGRRHALRLEVLARQLDATHANALRAYIAQARRSSRQGLEACTLAAFTSLLERWQVPGHTETPA